MGTVRFDAVLVVEVDDVDAESAQRSVTGLRHVLGLAVDALERAVLTTLIAELGRQDDLVASALDGPSHEFLVLEWAVHVGGVEEVDAAVERLVNRGNRLAVVAHAVELAHTHAAEALRGDLEVLTQLATFHDHSLM